MSCPDVPTAITVSVTESDAALMYWLFISWLLLCSLYLFLPAGTGSCGEHTSWPRLLRFLASAPPLAVVPRQWLGGRDTEAVGPALRRLPGGQ